MSRTTTVPPRTKGHTDARECDLAFAPVENDSPQVITREQMEHYK